MKEDTWYLQKNISAKTVQYSVCSCKMGKIVKKYASEIILSGSRYKSISRQSTLVSHQKLEKF
jgi:hypothetical protein